MLATIVNNAVTNIEDTAIGANNRTEEIEQTTADKNSGSASNKDDIQQLMEILKHVTVGFHRKHLNVLLHHQLRVHQSLLKNQDKICI